MKIKVWVCKKCKTIVDTYGDMYCKGCGIDLLKEVSGMYSLKALSTIKEAVIEVPEIEEEEEKEDEVDELEYE